jgi:hypothetical protein
MQKVSEHNLGAGWLMEHFKNEDGSKENMKFSQHSTYKCITLTDESVKTLREIFKKVG